MIKVGTHWRSTDFTLFVVENVQDGWVHYAKADKFGNATESKYNCLIDAFTHRFSEIVN
jgi:hypothetical protein